MRDFAQRLLVLAGSGHGKRVAVLLAVAALSGCASLSNPVANGIPVRRVPEELLGESRAGMETIPLSLLRQPPPGAHIIAPGDVLDVFVEGVLDPLGKTPAPAGKKPEGEEGEKPLVGISVPVKPNGMIYLRLVPPIKVEGMTLEQAQEAVRQAYTVTKQIVPASKAIVVTLAGARTFRILVIRPDTTSATASRSVSGFGATASRTSGFVLNLGGGARGSRQSVGLAIDLPVGANDVLNALTVSGGLPQSDVVNELTIERRAFRGDQRPEDLVRQFEACPPGGGAVSLGIPGDGRVRIPLRYRPGQLPTIRPQDVVLYDGDVLYIEAQEPDVFYTGGLLPSGEHVLPRDSDLDVLDAITRVGGALNSGGISTVNIQGTLIQPGIGFSSPSLCSVIRKTPDGGQLAIRVDLDRAMRDRRERILIQPGDLLLLQERPEEGMARYFNQMFKLNFVYRFLDSSRAQGTASAMVP